MYRLTAVACRINPPLPNSIKGHMKYTAPPVLVTNQLHSRGGKAPFGKRFLWEMEKALLESD